jgi:hypothetical protein
MPHPHGKSLEFTGRKRIESGPPPYSIETIMEFKRRVAGFYLQGRAGFATNGKREEFLVGCPSEMGGEERAARSFLTGASE